MILILFISLNKNKKDENNITTIINNNNNNIKKNAIILLIMMLISSIYIVILENNKNETDEILRQLVDNEIELYGEMVTNFKEGEYKKSFQIKIDKIVINNKQEIKLDNKNIRLYIYVDKDYITNIFPGDYIRVYGKYDEISSYNNFYIFNYKEQMKRKNIYGSVDTENINIIQKNKNKFNYIRYTIIEFVIGRIEKKIKIHPGILIGILIGNTDLIEETVIDNFNKSNISHVLAVSGTHVSFIIVFIGAIIDKIIKNYKIKKFILIVILILFIYIIGFTPSVARAVIMGIILLISKIICRKSDVYNNLLVSGIIVLFINPYYIYDLGFLLSYLTTMRYSYIF